MQRITKRRPRSTQKQQAELSATRPRRPNLTLRPLIGLTPLAPRAFASSASARRRMKAPRQNRSAVSVPSISSYTPGAGLIEEEVIEGEEFEAVPHLRRHKTEEHELDDFEEETLPTQIRSGELGEMLQEAHLDHRIQLNFDEKEHRRRVLR